MLDLVRMVCRSIAIILCIGTIGASDAPRCTNAAGRALGLDSDIITIKLRRGLDPANVVEKAVSINLKMRLQAQPFT